MPRRVRHFCNFVSKGALMSRRALMSSARQFFRPRETFSKDRSGRSDQNRPRIIKIGAILAIFDPFKVLQFGKNLDQKDEKNPHATFGRIQPIVPGFMLKPFINRTFPGTFV